MIIVSVWVNDCIIEVQWPSESTYLNTTEQLFSYWRKTWNLLLHPRHPQMHLKTLGAFQKVDLCPWGQGHWDSNFFEIFIRCAHRMNLKTLSSHSWVIMLTNLVVKATCHLLSHSSVLSELALLVLNVLWRQEGLPWMCTEMLHVVNHPNFITLTLFIHF